MPTESAVAERPAAVVVEQPLRVAVLATITDFGGIEQVLLTSLQHPAAAVDLFPILFTRQDAERKSFFELLQALDVPHVTYVNTRKRTYFNVVRNLRDALSVFRARQFDVIHCHGYRADLLGIVASWRFGIPAVATCHGFISTNRNLRFYRRFDVMLLRCFAKVIAVSTQMKQELVAAGLNPSQVEVVPNAVSHDGSAADRESRAAVRAQLKITADEFVFGFVGRLSEEKGLDRFIHAFQALPPRKGGFRAVLVGDGPQRQELEATIGRLGLAGTVHFAGFQSDTARWYAAMDAFVLPSFTEGTPVALLEAMAHGVPVIATAVGGVPAVLSDRRNGLLVPSGDEGALLLAMQELASDQVLGLRLSVEGQRSIRANYDVQAWSSRISAIYRAAATNRSSAP